VTEDRSATRRSIAVGLVAGAGALTLALWGVVPSAIFGAFGSMAPGWLLPVAAVFLFQQALRAERQVLLLRAVHPELGFRNSYAILCVSFFFINTLPARLGEVLRPALLLEREGVPLGAGFGMVFLERAIDLVSVLAMMGVVLLAVPLPPGTLVVGGQELALGHLARSVAMAALPLAVLVPVILALFPRHIQAFSRRLANPTAAMAEGTVLRRLWLFVLRFSDSFVAAVQVLRSPSRLSAILGLTVATWSVTALMYEMMAAAFGIGSSIRFFEGMGVLAITMLGMTLPSPPAFAGVYEASGRAGLVLFGVRGGNLDGIAVAYVLAMHWFTYGVQATTALWFLYRDGLSFRRLFALAWHGGRSLVFPVPVQR
jgi:glycosyltransferase 2 family protein